MLEVKTPIFPLTVLLELWPAWWSKSLHSLVLIYVDEVGSSLDEGHVSRSLDEHKG